MHKKYCVFTVIVGDYDTVKQPVVVDDRFDYILFSDSKIKEAGVWTVRAIPYETDRRWLKARFPRLNPHLLLPEYDAWLYTDGTVKIISGYVYDRCVELYSNGIEWAGMVHQCRDCLYDEMDGIIALKWAHDYDVLDWYCFLRKQGFPEHYGLFETGVIFRSNTNNVKIVNETWWWSLEKYRIRRDQFSNMYALWKQPGIKIDNFLPAGQTVWKNDGCFEYTPHVKPKTSKVLPFSLWEKLRYRYLEMFYGGEKEWEIHYTQWFDKLINKPFPPQLLMHLWTAWMLVRYDLGFLIGRAWMRLAGERKNK